LKHPTLKDIVRINRRHLEISGEEYFEPDNLKEKGTLKWVLETIQYPLFGVDRYPGLVEKAAKLTWTIISGHLFWDGNKRTGMSTLYLFLLLNGYQLDASEDEIVEIARRIAQANLEPIYSYEEFVQWVRNRIMIG
jgi:death-on-curing protein